MPGPPRLLPERQAEQHEPDDHEPDAHPPEGRRALVEEKHAGDNGDHRVRREAAATIAVSSRSTPRLNET